MSVDRGKQPPTAWSGAADRSRQWASCSKLLLGWAVDPGGRWYIIGVLTAREVQETHRAQEEKPHQVGASSGPAADQTPSAVQLRSRILEMSAVFAELGDGALRAVARRMRALNLTARDTLRLNAQGGDVVVFVASGQVEESITDGTGKVLLSRRPAPGDMVILPAPRTRDRYVTNIYGLTDAVLLTLDRDGLLEGLGVDSEKVAAALDRLWEQELSAVHAVEVQRSSRTAAPDDREQCPAGHELRDFERAVGDPGSSGRARDQERRRGARCVAHDDRQGQRPALDLEELGRHNQPADLCAVSRPFDATSVGRATASPISSWNEASIAPTNSRRSGTRS